MDRDPERDATTAPVEPPGTLWLEHLRSARFGDAQQAFLMARDAGALDARTVPDDAQSGLAVLADLESLLRDKAFARATSRLDAFSDRPPLLDWTALEAELATLRDASRSLERKRADEAAEGLADLEARYFVAEAATQRGTVAILQNRPEEATGHFEAALAHDPKHYRAMTNLGNVALEEGRTDEAVALYERALKLDENFANAHHNLGVAYRRQGKVAKSVRSLRRAQQALQRHQTDEARASARNLARGQAGRAIRWVLTAGAAIAAVLVLRALGVL